MIEPSSIHTFIEVFENGLVSNDCIFIVLWERFNHKIDFLVLIHLCKKIVFIDFSNDPYNNWKIKNG